MKWVLLLTLAFYLFVLFNPKFTVKVNGVKSDSVLYRFLGAFAFALVFFVIVGLPLFGIICLFS